ncbi:MAG: hypothetical protein GXP35_08965 [Actinobacteria bacterium]|nr:hypothetical protein [Actinomycetota bacterium]
MSNVDTSRLLSLLGLRLKGFASAEAIAELLDVDTAEITAALEAAANDGLVTFNEARSVYILDSAVGRPEGERLLSEQLDNMAVRADVEAAYAAFLKLNGQMLQLCTDWQIRSDTEEQTLNDHTDDDYDQDVIGRLVDLDGQMRPILASLRTAVDRYSAYGPRFRAALDNLLAGELEYFTKPIIASYHTVWFELHEDLLATLGIDRASEGSS